MREVRCKREKRHSIVKVKAIPPTKPVPNHALHLMKRQGKHRYSLTAACIAGMLTSNVSTGVDSSSHVLLQNLPWLLELNFFKAVSSGHLKYPQLHFFRPHRPPKYRARLDSEIHVGSRTGVNIDVDMNAKLQFCVQWLPKPIIHLSMSSDRAGIALQLCRSHLTHTHLGLYCPIPPSLKRLSLG
ncbi:uncharacterized protein K452DRAFT_156933 [Aplosporella prunicola CBS 121167]|uniref:Uncharacterized protein n=1 Tax=Aplosporella prunicola CBS 121167 TaxID=1176127 RepID=A0A6A6BKZ1_9PEZI|nr:uncharacterized protein K452DRAFT_156933 [Aplosporella prunicola CBS 121167]KAF2144328.1 hypothetical protein K452DRAFT_156933 [Aplosporella prunicola CBS 121167]